MKWWTKCISIVIAKTASRNVAFKSDKLMDALFQEGQSASQTPQTLFDADFEGLASNAELYIFDQEDRLWVIRARIMFFNLGAQAVSR